MAFQVRNLNLEYLLLFAVLIGPHHTSNVDKIFKKLCDKNIRSERHFLVKIFLSNYYSYISKSFQDTEINDEFLYELYLSIDICGTEMSKN